MINNINNIVVQTPEVIAKVITKPDAWTILGAKSTFWSLVFLIFINLITAFFWLRENIYINRKKRYLVEEGHPEEWINTNLSKIDQGFVKNKIFPNGLRQKTIYCIKIINRGTTNDYIYRAELVNSKGEKVDVSTDCIIKGTPLTFENLPHKLEALQGEVWFLGLKDERFLLEKKPTLVIYSAAGEFPLHMNEKMFVSMHGYDPGLPVEFI